MEKQNRYRRRADRRAQLFQTGCAIARWTVIEERLDSKNYLQIVAATNFKQRVRKNMEYFHADRLHYAVVGTPNRLEYDQGFFVKNGDGSADVKPIAHLYKTQVYAMASYLGLPEEVCNAQPTTDTYSMARGTTSFTMLCLTTRWILRYWPTTAASRLPSWLSELGIGLDQAEFIYHDIEAKRKTTAMLHWPGIAMETVIGPNTKPPMLGSKIKLIQ